MKHVYFIIIVGYRFKRRCLREEEREREREMHGIVVMSRSEK